ncbi:MAG: type II toxin-antitoxin system HicB family antitoxin [Hassallia sp. WJT32-NPBG1]|jgi:predicted RNase H-like HicB family nuclease|nr:type II toxin-antitoxin system HicB family antitoxin [Hassallia sp. WJT32-NPBG1]
MNSHYTIIIQWSDEDNCYVVSLPEWGEFCHTHGDTYEEAVKNAQEVLEMLIESSLEDGELLPEPQTLGKTIKVIFEKEITS